MALLGVVAFAFLGTGPVHVARLGNLRNRKLDSHGSAAWGSFEDAVNGDHVAPPKTPSGIRLGRLKMPHGAAKSHDSRYRATSHIVTIAGTRAGKGVGSAVPNLLEYPGSTFTVDVKSELYFITARARMERGFSVARLDPFGLTGKPSHSINWLDRIDPDAKNCVSESARLAEALVVRSEKEDPHWNNQAAYLLQGLILHVATLPETDRHIGTVRNLIMLPIEELSERLKDWSKNEKRGCGVIAKAANSFLGKEPKERSGILSAAQGHTNFLDDPHILDTVKRSDFSFADLKRSALSVYVIVPLDLLEAYSRYVRVTFILALQAMSKERKRKLPHHVLFLMDEFGQLGSLAAVEKAMPALQGFGALLWIFIQDLGQLRAVYRKWSTFLGNAVWQIFGTNDQETAEYISKTLGTKTVRVQTHGASNSVGTGRESTSQSSNETFVSRPLLFPDEVRGLPTTKVVVMQRSERPMMLERLNYLRHGWDSMTVLRDLDAFKSQCSSDQREFEQRFLEEPIAPNPEEPSRTVPRVQHWLTSNVKNTLLLPSTMEDINCEPVEGGTWSCYVTATVVTENLLPPFKPVPLQHRSTYVASLLPLRHTVDTPYGFSVGVLRELPAEGQGS